MADTLAGMPRMRKIMFIIIWMENEELLSSADCRVGSVSDETASNGVESMITAFANASFVLALPQRKHSFVILM